ncbi:MAG TPA: cytochrome c biogenesis protein CcdA [Candidatus Limnocylindrales bacterium]|jgi:cytochrome c biogenesis protein CcdA
MTSGIAQMPGRRAAVAGIAVLVAGAATLVAVAVPMPTAADHTSLTSLTVPTIVVAGFLDGFNPCAFGVLILFATFALGLAARESTAGGPDRRPAVAASRAVLGLGSFFVIGVLLTYFLLGLGLLTAVATFTNFGGNHLPSRLAALVAVALGIWMLRDVLLPDSDWQLMAPHALHGRMRSWARTSSPLALLGGGILIGLCTVPCSGAVYLGVVALLGASGSVAAGLGGLALYNLAYITPLVLLLLLASRPGVIRAINRWHLAHTGSTKLVLALVVLALGFAILLTV